MLCSAIKLIYCIPKKNGERMCGPQMVFNTTSELPISFGIGMRSIEEVHIDLLNRSLYSDNLTFYGY